MISCKRSKASGRRSGRASAGATAERYAFVGWKLTELGVGAELNGPCRSEESGLPKTKRKESPMMSFLGGKAAAMSAQLYEDICAEEVMAGAAMMTIEAQETNASQETDVLQKTPEEGGEEEMLPDETAIAACPDAEKIATPSTL